MDIVAVVVATRLVSLARELRLALAMEPVRMSLMVRIRPMNARRALAMALECVTRWPVPS